MPNNKRRILLYGGKRSSRPCILWLWSKRLSYKRNSEAYNWILRLLLTAWSNILSMDLRIKNVFLYFRRFPIDGALIARSTVPNSIWRKPNARIREFIRALLPMGWANQMRPKLRYGFNVSIIFEEFYPLRKIRKPLCFCHISAATYMYSNNVIVSAVNSKDMVVLRLWTLLAKNGSCWYGVRLVQAYISQYSHLKM